MTLLTDFEDGLKVAVIGASGGIGNALVHLLSNEDKVEKIYAFSRSNKDFSRPKVLPRQLDICDEASIKNAVHRIEENLDIVILTTGILHDDNGLTPEKSLRDINKENFDKVFAVNTFGPALVMKYFLPLLRRDSKSVFAALSARVGSISDNGLGGWYAYRASKAALNMLLKNASIEVARRNKNACIIGLHPGTVDTGLSGPFQGNVKEGKLFTPEFSAQSLLGVINSRNAGDTGKVFDWDNKEILS